MGRIQAEEMSQHADLDTGLIWHLTVNHFPPIPARMVEPAKAAIALANDGEWDEPVPGLTTIHGEPVTAAEAVREWHLDPWIEEGGD